MARASTSACTVGVRIGELAPDGCARIVDVGILGQPFELGEEPRPELPRARTRPGITSPESEDPGARNDRLDRFTGSAGSASAASK